jgi:hypothetical protein
MQFMGILLRTHFSLHHAQAASFHARQAAGMVLDGNEETAIALGAHVSAAVISAGAFLEATVNEISESDQRGGALERLNTYLKAHNAQCIPESDPRWQAAKTLMDLRNRLVHYTHDWLDEGSDHMIGDKALNKSALLTRMQAEFAFLSPPGHYIPRFLSSDCAAWAIGTATALLDEFFRRLNAQPFYDNLRDRIEVKRQRSPCP